MGRIIKIVLISSVGRGRGGGREDMSNQDFYIFISEEDVDTLDSLLVFFLLFGLLRKKLILIFI